MILSHRDETTIALWIPKIFSASIVIIFCVLSSGKMNGYSAMLYLRQTADISFAVIGSGLIYLVGDINLASGGQVYFGYAFLCFLLYAAGFDPFVAVLLLLLFAFLLGLLYAALRNRVEIKTIYFSFALQAVLYGSAGLLPTGTGSRDPGMAFSAINGSPGIFPVWPMLWVGVLFFVTLILSRTSIGRCLAVSRVLETIPARKKTSVRITGFSLVAGCILISLSSLMLFAKMGGAPVSLSKNYTYDVLAGMFLGGIGGSRSKYLIARAISGSVAIVLLNAVLLFTGLSAPMEMLIKGVIILLGCYFTNRVRQPE